MHEYSTANAIKCSYTEENILNLELCMVILVFLKWCMIKLSLKCIGMSEEEKERLLHCVVIGGGPTGVEFSGELSDFIMRDVRQRYAHVKNYIKVTLIEV